MSESQPLSESEKRCRLRLARTQNIGPVTFRALINQFGNGTDALAALPELAAKGGRSRALKIFPKSQSRRRMRNGKQHQPSAPRFISSAIRITPNRWRRWKMPPPFICVRGHATLLQTQAIAMVGSRNASVNGKRFAREIAQGLCDAALTVVSGMARGIDTAAHEGAINGATIAVLAGGVDNIYPKENTALYEQICQRGLVVSEMPPGTTPQARHFPRRNRIISGLSFGVVVVEAALRSGSLITARRALEQGREVFSVPGSPLDPRCRGTNDLIRNGAILTESVDDILNELDAIQSRHLKEHDEKQFDARPPQYGDAPDMKNARASIMEALGPSPVPIDGLIRETGISPNLVHAILLEIDLAGRLERHAGQRVSLIVR